MPKKSPTSQRLTISQFAEKADRPQATARHWAHAFAERLDARRIGGRLTVSADLAEVFLQGEPLRAGRDAA